MSTLEGGGPGFRYDKHLTCALAALPHSPGTQQTFSGHSSRASYSQKCSCRSRSALILDALEVRFFFFLHMSTLDNLNSHASFLSALRTDFFLGGVGVLGSILSASELVLHPLG